MANEIHQTWFLEEFWPAYLMLCRTPEANGHGAGVKSKCFATVIKNKSKLTEDIRKRIVENVHAQITHRNTLYDRLGRNMAAYEAFTVKSPDKQFYGNRHGQTFLNDTKDGILDDIPVIPTYNEPQKGKCLTCGDPVHGHFKYCGAHLPVAGLSVVK